MRSYKHNFKIKLLSVIFAFTMWLYVMAEVDPIIIRTIENIPITSIENIEEIADLGLTFSYGQNFAVKIDFRAKRSLLNEVINKGISPVGSIDNPSIGSNVMDISLDLPREIEYSISPENLNVNLEKSVIALKPVEIKTTGIQNTDFVVAGITTSKNQLYVEGPKTQIDKVDKLLGVVEVGSNTGIFTSQAKLTPVDNKGNKVEGLVVSNASVVVEITMEKTKLVPVKVVLLDEDGLKLETKYIIAQGKQVKIQGPEQKVNSLTEVLTKPISINTFNNIENKVFELEPVQGIKFELPTVNITFVESEMQNYSIKIKKEDLIFLGASDAELIKEVLPDEITIDIRSGKENSSLVNQNNLKVYIENVLLSSNGEYSFSAKANFPYSSLKINPSFIKIQS